MTKHLHEHNQTFINSPQVIPVAACGIGVTGVDGITHNSQNVTCAACRQTELFGRINAINRMAAR